MKLLKILLPAFFVLFTVFVMLIHHFRADPNAPGFLRTDSAPADLIRQPLVDYFEVNTFRDGYVWLHTLKGAAQRHSYLFNIDRRQIVGELINMDLGCTRGFNADQSKLIFDQHMGLVKDSARGKIAAYISRITHGKINFQNSNSFVNLWMLDLQKGSARKIARIEQPYFVALAMWNFSSGHQRAFGYEFGYPEPVPGQLKTIFHVIDLETGDVQEILVHGRPIGWWDGRQIMIRNHDANFVLLDTVTKKTNIFLSSQTISEFLVQNHLPDVPTNALAFSVPHGQQNDFYLGYFNNFLIKVNRAGPRLELLSQPFSDTLYQPAKMDSTLTYSVDMHPTIFEDTHSPGNPLPWRPHGGIFRHKLADNTTTTLVSDGPKVSYSFPKFYRDNIIYQQNGAVWQMDMNGSNKLRLFPPLPR